MEDDFRFNAIKILTVTTLGYAAWHLYTKPASYPYLSIVLGGTSVSLFFWTTVHVRKKLSLAFSSDIPQSLYACGPYFYVRHPFYLSYLLGYAAVLSACLTPIAMLLNSFALFAYFKAARFEEAKFERSELAAPYSEYADRTGMFLPRFKW